MEWGAVSILSLRKAAGMTQAQLAGWLGVTIKQVKHLEHQRRNPSGPASRLLDILAQQIGMGNGGRVQVLGADAGAAPKPAVEESQSEPARETPVGRPDDSFVWQ
jgi:transcriptional regulator with XRE-family HTH domain